MPTKAELLKLVEKLKTRMGEYSDGWRWSPMHDQPLLEELHSALLPVEYPPDVEGIGEDLIEVIEANYAKLKAAGWSGVMDSPVEAVTDLLNLLEESKARIDYLTKKAHSLSGVTIVYHPVADDNGLKNERGFIVTSFHNKGEPFDTVEQAIDDAIHRDKE